MKNKYLRLIRIDNWIKNLLILAPLFFGQQLFNVDLLIKTTVAFICFSLITSGTYIINDYLDINEDREHPVKKFRPLASGEILKKNGLLISVFFLAIGLLGGFLLSNIVFYILVVYIGLNLLYNFRLKRMAIIDVCTVSIMYIIRLAIGSQVTGISLSMWIILITFFMAMFISLAKRRDDVVYLEDGINTRRAAKQYNLEYLNASMMLTASIVVVSYIMFATSPAEIVRIHSDKLYLTSIFVVLAILRYMQVIMVEKRHGSPVKIFIEDRFVQYTFLGWAISLGLFLYI